MLSPAATPRPTARHRPDTQSGVPPAATSPTADQSTLLTDTAGAARLCDVSARTWRRLDSAGKCPRGVMIGGSKKYRIAELVAWVTAGCPDRKAWEAMQREA